MLNLIPLGGGKIQGDGRWQPLRDTEVDLISLRSVKDLIFSRWLNGIPQLLYLSYIGKGLPQYGTFIKSLLSEWCARCWEMLMCKPTLLTSGS